MADDLADESVDNGIAECPAAVGIAEQVSFDEKSLFIVGSHELCEGVVAQLEVESLATCLYGTGIGDIAVDVARVEEANEQLNDIAILTRDWNDEAAGGEISGKDDRGRADKLGVDVREVVILVLLLFARSLGVAMGGGKIWSRGTLLDGSQGGV